MEIKVGILISYDYIYAIRCITQIYNGADKIVLALDKDRCAWNGEKFNIEQSFFDEVRKIDINSKIEIFEDNFHLKELTSMQNETRERNMLAEYMGAHSGWHIQLDADEYFINFDSFVSYLHTIEPKIRKHKIAIKPTWINLFKKDKDGYYVVVSKDNSGVPTATNHPYYTMARGCHQPFIINIKNGHEVLHESWSRSEQEVAQKLACWGHNSDFDTAEYFNFWKSINTHNAPFIKNFHPLPWMRNTWEGLEFRKGDINDLIDSYLSSWDEEKVKKLNAKYLRQAFLNRNLVFRGFHFVLRRIKKLFK